MQTNCAAFESGLSAVSNHSEYQHIPSKAPAASLSCYLSRYTATPMRMGITRALALQPTLHPSVRAPLPQARPRRLRRACRPLRLYCKDPSFVSRDG